jgi:hypothetical protein
VLSGYAPTATEQVLLERLNDARANPAAYGQSIGLDLSGVVASQPLAFDPRLVQAAHQHAQDMNDRNYFGHTSPGGLNAGGRIAAAGFSARSWGESIAAGYSGPEAALRALVIDDGVPGLGHRKHLLAIDAVFRDQNLAGAGVVSGGGSYGTYFTIDTASEYGARPYLTGVVYNDANGNGRYDAGEGLGGVSVSVPGGPSVTTFASGGYSLGLAPGSYTVTYSGGGLGTAITRAVTLGATNVRVNVTPGTASTATPNDPNAAWLAGVYESLLRRTPGPVDYGYWLGVMRAGQTRDVVMAAITGSPECIRVQGRAWLEHVYRALLDRAPGQLDYDYWLWVLDQGVTRQQAVAMILSSPEHRSVDNRRWLEQAYQNLLGRSAGAADFSYWLWVLDQGVTRPQAVAMIAMSPEFNQGLSGASGAWLGRVYQRVLGREASAVDVAYWTGVADRGTDRAGMALMIAGSPEALARETDAWVGQLYRDLLGREASAADLRYWLWVTQVGGTRDGIVAGFATSPEFTTRVASSF